MEINGLEWSSPETRTFTANGCLTVMSSRLGGTSGSEEVEKSEPLYTAGGCVELCGHFGKQLDSVSKR